MGTSTLTITQGGKKTASGHRAVPTGTVTLVLGDVEGSTRQWAANGTAMAHAVRSLDALITETVERHGGVRPIEQGEGDSFVAVFARPTAALACAVDL